MIFEGTRLVFIEPCGPEKGAQSGQKKRGGGVSWNVWLCHAVFGITVRLRINMCVDLGSDVRPNLLK